MSRIVFSFFLLLIMPATEANLLVEQPARSHGYFIGDVLVQRINLDSLDEPVAAQNLETELRIGTHLYRMASKEIIVEEQTWLELRYQIINVQTVAETIALPAVSFKTASGSEEIVQPWTFTVAPLTSSENELSPLPDRRARVVVKQHSSDKLKVVIAALIATLTLWLVWWLVRHFRDAHTLPFAQAHRKIKKLPVTERDSDEQSWIALLHAFNSVAGKTINNGAVDHLFTAVPWLADHSDAIERFYAASSARFYQQSDSQSFAVTQLCATLRRAEKQQARNVRKAADGLGT